MINSSYRKYEYQVHETSEHEASGGSHQNLHINIIFKYVISKTAHMLSRQNCEHFSHRETRLSDIIG